MKNDWLKKIWKNLTIGQTSGDQSWKYVVLCDKRIPSKVNFNKSGATVITIRNFGQENTTEYMSMA